MTTLHVTSSPVIVVLITEPEIVALLPEWNALWHKEANASPFLSPAWLWSWWRRLGGGDLRVFTARVDGRLVAVLPMFIWDDAGVRRMLPLAISVSDAFDLLVEAGWQRQVQGLLGPLFGEDGDWDRCELHEVPQDSALLWLDGAGLRSVVQRQSMSPLLDLAGFAAQGNRSAPIRKLRRARTRAEALGAVQIERLGPRTPPGVIRDVMEQLFALHAAQWQARGEAGVLAGPALHGFHHDVAAAMAADGTLLLLRLFIAGSVAGVFYGFLRGTHAYVYATGTDPAITSIGPGTLLIGAAIEAAHAAGARHFDFLRGQETYKYDWGAVDRPTMRITLAQPARTAGMTDLGPATAHAPTPPTRTTRMVP